MSLTVAVLIYLGIVTGVSSIMTYYFRVMRPREEKEFAGNYKGPLYAPHPDLVKKTECDET